MTTTEPKPKKKGQEGEALVADFLEKNNYRILEKNFTCKGGEIDIIARDLKGYIVFVEVKHYKKSWLHPLEAITAKKQKHLIKAAKIYL